MSSSAKRQYEFGPFLLDPAEGRLLRDGVPIPLEPKVFLTLVLLVENSGHLLKKDELMEQVWPDAVVEEGSLTRNISTLRRILGEAYNGSPVIETVPKRGYRFVMPVTALGFDKDKGSVIAADPQPVYHDVDARTTVKPEPRSWFDRLRNRKVAISVILLGVITLSIGIYFLLRPKPNDRIDSIAVLPLANASNDPSVEYLSDGISEALINSLSELHQLRVVGRSKAFRYKGKDVDPQAVGRELNVRAVLTGRVRQIGDALNIQVDLVDTATGAQLWGKEYERKVSDVLSAKQTIALEVTTKLRLRLSGEEQQRLVKSDTTNPEAYQLYLKGRYFWNKKTDEGYKRGQEYFQQAIDLDPAYAPAYTGVADTNLALGSYLIGLSTPREAWAGAESAAKQALSLDDTLSEAHASLAWMTTLYKWNWPEAEHEYKRAIELKPDYATAHHWYAHLLIYLGRPEEALSASQRGLALDPLDLTLNAHLGWHYLYARQYDLALAQLRKTLEMDPNFSLAHWYLGLTYEQKGMFAETIAEFQKVADLSKRSPTMVASLGHAYAVAGQPAEARKILFELHELSKQRYVLPYCFALIHAGLNEKDQAFVYLEKSYQQRDSSLIHLKVEPRLDGLRSDPRFGDLLRRVGLPQ